MPWCNEGHELQPKDKYCARCGGKPITECENGHKFRPVYDQQSDIEIAPDFCAECGVRYPWSDR